nr:integrase, catalytic region, zinc finger, CCHC-type, peptidase aspartic, catalytic [Tanacetum cinerariifolium]
NFVWKFLGTVRFGNDHIAAFLGYGDLKWENITITGVYFVKVTMEILLEPTLNKLLVGDVGDSIWIELVTLDINLGPDQELEGF